MVIIVIEPDYCKKEMPQYGLYFCGVLSERIFFLPRTKHFNPKTSNFTLTSCIRSFAVRNLLNPLFFPRVAMTTTRKSRIVIVVKKKNNKAFHGDISRNLKKYSKFGHIFTPDFSGLFWIQSQNYVLDICTGRCTTFG